MKKKHFFLPLLAALAMTACTNEDEPILDDATGNGNGEGNGEYGYVAVNIIQGDGSRSRADDTGFVYGSDDENEAKTATFYIFDAAGKIIGSPSTHSLTPDPDVPGSVVGGNVERQYQVVLVLDGVTDEEKGNPAKIVCLLNAPEFTGITQLSDLQGKVDDYCTNNKTAGKFVMSNSVYVDATGTVVATPIESNNISKSSAEALANPVEIHVERVVAKVNMKKTSGNFTYETKSGVNIMNDDNTATSQITLTPHITGIELANIAKQSYLLKNVDNSDAWGITDFGNWWKGGVANYRSFWESMPAITDASTFYANQNYTDIVSKSYKDATITEGDVLDKLGNFDMYIQPNTNQGQKTAVLVTAELCDASGKTVDFVKLRGGYYTPGGALKAIATYVQQWGYYYQEDGLTGEAAKEYHRLTPDFFTWRDKHDDSTLTWLTSYETVAHLGEKMPVPEDSPEGTEGKAYSIYTYDADKDEMTKVDNGIAEINNKLHGTSENDKKYVALYYNGGKSYYFVNIDQTPVANEHKGAAVTPYDAGTYEGVVRNHYYQLTLNGINGLGTPVFDPSDIIIPERVHEEELSYLAATVKVLSWKFVNQEVTFH